MINNTGTSPRYKMHSDLIPACHHFVMRVGRFDVYHVTPDNGAGWPPLVRACTRYQRSIILRNINGRVAVMDDEDRHFEGDLTQEEATVLQMAVLMTIPSQGDLCYTGELRDWLDDLILEPSHG